MAKKKTWRLTTEDRHERTIEIRRGEELHLTVALTNEGEVAVRQPTHFSSVSFSERPVKGVVPLDQLDSALEQLAEFREEQHG